MGGVSSPATDDACEPLVETFFDPVFEDNLEAAVFFVSPFSAFLAILAAFDAETGMVCVLLKVRSEEVEAVEGPLKKPGSY